MLVYTVNVINNSIAVGHQFGGYDVTGKPKIACKPINGSQIVEIKRKPASSHGLWSASCSWLALKHIPQITLCMFMVFVVVL